MPTLALVAAMFAPATPDAGVPQFTMPAPSCVECVYHDAAQTARDIQALIVSIRERYGVVSR